MPSSDKLTIHEMTQLGVLLAAAIALRLAETSLAWLLPLPGAHLGLANTVTIIVLYLYGPGKTALFLTCRILLTGLLFTGLLTPGFLIGLGGAALSFAGMALARKHQWFSTVGVGLLGAFLHNCGQILVAVAIMRTPALFSYLPPGRVLFGEDEGKGQRRLKGAALVRSQKSEVGSPRTNLQANF